MKDNDNIANPNRFTCLDVCLDHQMMAFCLFRLLCRTFSAGAALCVAGLAYQSGLKIQAEPIQVSDTRLAELDRFARSKVQSDQFGNIAYGLWQGGALLQSGFHGPVQPSQADTVAEDTIYQIYSMTKPVTAVGLMILHERGYFDLDDPITTVLPELDEIEVVADYDENDRLFTYLPPHAPTFRQLLSHSAGFAYQSAERSPIDRKYIALGVTESPTGDELVARVASVPLMRTPGAEWHYSIASDLQGVIIERLTGETLHAFLKREIFDRLAMHDTGFFVDEAKAKRISAVSQHENGKLIYQPRANLSEAHQGRTFFEGGHGLMSTLEDYHRFLELLRRGGRTGPIEILAPESVEALTTNAIRYHGQPAPQRGYGSQSGLGYGFGVSIIENPEVAGMSAPKGTYYWYGALGSWFWVDPQNEIVFIGMIQTPDPVAPDMIAATMARVYGAAPRSNQTTTTP